MRRVDGPRLGLQPTERRPGTGRLREERIETYAASRAKSAVLRASGSDTSKTTTEAAEDPGHRGRSGWLWYPRGRGASRARLGRGVRGVVSSSSPPAGFVPGRVTLEHQHIYTVHTGHSDLLATVAGSLRHKVAARREFPAVGDWVALRALVAGRRAVIHAVLPRRSKFSRKVAGDETDEQIVAANIDTVFLMMGLDRRLQPAPHRALPRHRPRGRRRPGRRPQQDRRLRRRGCQGGRGRGCRRRRCRSSR